MDAETVATIDLVFKVVVTGGLIMIMVKTFTLDGAFNQFMGNHWKHFMDKFDDTAKKVDDLDNRVQKIEDGGGTIDALNRLLENLKTMSGK